MDMTEAIDLVIDDKVSELLKEQYFPFITESLIDALESSDLASTEAICRHLHKAYEDKIPESKEAHLIHAASGIISLLIDYHRKQAAIYLGGM